MSSDTKGTAAHATSHGKQEPVRAPSAPWTTPCCPPAELSSIEDEEDADTDVAAITPPVKSLNKKPPAMVESRMTNALVFDLHTFLQTSQAEAAYTALWSLVALGKMLPTAMVFSECLDVAENSDSSYKKTVEICALLTD
ncbi:hypothetical protein SDRG_13410 [Saprolegnia diclina VS20]|uniref:Uncharacterized protein n=1 Tax=Saprolegnia diclina (strain VS20) TaxID=1156394 RepID=T0Q634_SAPDV|nr:hypothetical protein SDRG_13410 [Saprolegnia diclina VS20]EQC28900.1 hypothetical protein SDRG_13410 [Saprolegnia diclina VS20]|eukprot:XP_008617717.1 hypothetical protein SDRG_13410 [Saprolegnia diclina VS20]